MVSRERRPSRHRATPHSPTAAMADEELESYLAALSPPVDSSRFDGYPEAHPEATGRFGTAQVFQVRLPGHRIEQVRRLAEARGVSPHALLVGWVLERLEWEEAQPGSPVPRAPIAPHSTAAHHATWPRAMHPHRHGPAGYHGPAPAGARIGALSELTGPGRALAAPYRSAPADSAPIGHATAPADSAPIGHATAGHATTAYPATGDACGPLDPPAPSALPPALPGAPPLPAWPSPPGAPTGAALPPRLDEAPAPSYPRLGQPSQLAEPPARLLDSVRSTSATLLPDPLTPLADASLAEVQPPDRAHRPVEPWSPVADALTSLAASPLATDIETGRSCPDAEAPDAEAPAADGPAEARPGRKSKPKFGQVTPIFRAGMELPDPDEHRGPRHRAPEPVTSLLTRRKF